VAILSKLKSKERDLNWFTEKFQQFAEWYSTQLTALMQKRRRQNWLIVIMILLIVTGILLPVTGILKSSLFPAVDIDFAIVNVELAPGATKDATTTVMTEMENRLLTIPEIESYVANIGSSASIDLGGGSSGQNVGSLFINLHKERERTSIEVTEEMRTLLTGIPGAVIRVTEISAGPPTAPPVEVRIVGPELSTLDSLSQKVVQHLQGINGAIEIESNLDDSAGEFTFRFDSTALAEAGLTAADASQALRTTVFGFEATSFLNRYGDEVEVRIEGSPAAIDSVSEIAALPLTTPRGTTVTVGQVAQVSLENSYASILRRNGDRTVTVNAKAAPGITPNEVSAALEIALASAEVPDSYRFEFGGEQEETVETFNDLYRSMFISVVLILLILVVEFNSYRQPWVIFLSVPLALIGVLYGLLLLNTPLSFATFIGLISLVGIVVNDAIILVDRMNSLLRQSGDLMQSVLVGAKSRLQPVILTTLTTAGGVLPLIFVDEFFRDMSLTVITGLLFSTILTLVFIPMLYLRQQQRFFKKRQRYTVAG